MAYGCVRRRHVIYEAISMACHMAKQHRRHVSNSGGKTAHIMAARSYLASAASARTGGSGNKAAAMAWRATRRIRHHLANGMENQQRKAKAAALARRMRRHGAWRKAAHLGIGVAWRMALRRTAAAWLESIDQAAALSISKCAAKGDGGAGVAKTSKMKSKANMASMAIIMSA